MGICDDDCGQPLAAIEKHLKLRISQSAGPDAARQLRTEALQWLAARGERTDRGRAEIDLTDAENLHGAVIQVLLALQKEVDLVADGDVPVRLKEPLQWCGVTLLAAGPGGAVRCA